MYNTFKNKLSFNILKICWRINSLISIQIEIVLTVTDLWLVQLLFLRCKTTVQEMEKLVTLPNQTRFVAVTILSI